MEFPIPTVVADVIASTVVDLLLILQYRTAYASTSALRNIVQPSRPLVRPGIDCAYAPHGGGHHEDQRHDHSWNGAERKIVIEQTQRLDERRPLYRRGD